MDKLPPMPPSYQASPAPARQTFGPWLLVNLMRSSRRPNRSSNRERPLTRIGSFASTSQLIQTPPTPTSCAVIFSSGKYRRIPGQWTQVSTNPKRKKEPPVLVPPSRKQPQRPPSANLPRAQNIANPPHSI